MTRKDFELIAAAMLAAKPCETWDLNKHAQHAVDARRLADALAGTNPRFNRARFLRACGVDESRIQE